jgi:hypothetical protein
VHAMRTIPTTAIPFMACPCASAPKTPDSQCENKDHCGRTVEISRLGV